MLLCLLTGLADARLQLHRWFNQPHYNGFTERRVDRSEESQSDHRHSPAPRSGANFSPLVQSAKQGQGFPITQEASLDYPNPLLQYIHTRFREVFGEPYSTLALDSQWSLRCAPEAPAIFILVNGSYDKPAVWIFDPYTADNVWRDSAKSIEDVDSAIAEIQRRTASAAASWRAAKA